MVLVEKRLQNYGLARCIPRAPASSNASACVRPRPRAAPDTNTTFPFKLNSGSPYVDDIVDYLGDEAGGNKKQDTRQNFAGRKYLYKGARNMQCGRKLHANGAIVDSYTESTRIQRSPDSLGIGLASDSLLSYA